ncbi:signal peptidase [Acinetobacter sp. ANC 5054]|nr:signal peptidase [Acinetobacter sp. ANC 5054]
MIEKNMKWAAVLGALVTSSTLFAQDLTGTWQQIDDKTGSPKALIEIRKDAKDTYTGKIIKVTPRPGYTPKEKCVNCPAPYTNQPILGMDVFKGLKLEGENTYADGKIIDPLAGKIYSLKGKISANGKRLHLRGYLGISAIGRTQTWIRAE